MASKSPGTPSIEQIREFQSRRARSVLLRCSEILDEIRNHYRERMLGILNPNIANDLLAELTEDHLSLQRYLSSQFAEPRLPQDCDSKFSAKRLVPRGLCLLIFTQLKHRRVRPR